MKQKIFYVLCLSTFLLLGGCLGDELDQERLILTLNSGKVNEPPYKTISKNNLLKNEPIIDTETFRFKLLRLYADEKNVCVIINVKGHDDVHRAEEIYDLQSRLNQQFDGEIVNAVTNATETSWIDCFSAPNITNFSIEVGDLDGNMTGESAVFMIE